jgi:hypothetical protein
MNLCNEFEISTMLETRRHKGTKKTPQVTDFIAPRFLCAFVSLCLMTSFNSFTDSSPASLQQIER